MKKTVAALVAAATIAVSALATPTAADARGWGGGWRGGGFRGGAFFGGLAAGALIGGAFAAPYYYGGQGNWLIPTFLKPGVHKFVVQAYDAANQMAVDTVQARIVAPPKPPAELAGNWKRSSPTGKNASVNCVPTPRTTPARTASPRHRPDHAARARAVVESRGKAASAVGWNIRAAGTSGQVAAAAHEAGGESQRRHIR